MARIIDVIECPDVTGKEIMRREPPNGPGDFRFGSQVIVRESQMAVFFRDGRALDIFAPGRHTITTANLPLLSDLIGMATSGKTPFTAEVVFVNMRQFIDQKWGTPQAVNFRDPDLWGAELRAFGAYTFQVTDVSRFVHGVVGQQGIFTTRDVEDYFRSMIVQRFLNVLGEMSVPLLDLTGMYNEISGSTRAMLIDDFSAIGTALTAFYISAITPTDDTKEAINELRKMKSMGFQNPMQYQAAMAMRDAAQNPGGDAGAGIGLGAGIGMGAGMAGMITQAFQQGAQQPPQPSPPAPQPISPSPTSPPPTPAEAAAPSSAALTREQIQSAIDTLDLRFSMGEISEETYSRMLQRWETRLRELGG